MDEVDRGEASVPELARAGDALRTAREAQGLSLADIATRTRVPQRHLEAIEVSDYSGLPSITYAVGFARAYARALGIDEVAIAAEVRAEVAATDRRAPRYEPYVAADPSRIPSRAVAIAGAGVALAILVLIGLWYASDLFRPAATTGGVAAGTGVVQPVAPASTLSPAGPTLSPAGPTLSPTGKVTLAATDEVWLRVYDGDNKTLFLGTMKAGDRFDVPGDAHDPMINVGRPDKLAVTLDGSALPALGTGERAIKDVKVSAAALAARAAGTPEPSSGAMAAGPSARTAQRARRFAPTPRSPDPRPSPVVDKPENLLPKGFSTATP